MAAKKPVIYRIHPSIGVARVGAGTQFFIGPEIPGLGATGQDAARGTTVPPYKQSPGTLKRQAARFRIWRYTWDKNRNTYVPDPSEVTIGGAVKKIKWTVELANRKASFFEFHGTNGEDPAEAFNPRRRNKRISTSREALLELTPGPRSISGLLQGPERFDFALPGNPITYLGELQTDDKGRLLVLGGLGKSAPSSTLALICGLPFPVQLKHYANSPTWFDDVSDGPVTAEIELTTGEKLSFDDIEAAWVLVGPPDFAPGLRSIVSLYDTLIDVWVRNATLSLPAASGAPGWMRDMKADFNPTSGFSSFRPEFVRDVLPVLMAARNTGWTHSPAQVFHNSWDWAKLADNSAPRMADRKRVFDYLRRPPSLTSVTAGSPANMPVLIGDEEIDENSSAPRDEDSNPDAGAPRRPPSAQPGPKTWLTVTAVQYAILRQWMLGNFDKTGWPASNKPADLPAPPATIGPSGLDQAALENCVGGAFYPGIEVGWLIRNPKLYETIGQSSLFRINQWRHAADGTVLTAAGRPLRRKIHYGSTAGGIDLPLDAGYFSQQMAVPWQADFMSCLKSAHDGRAAAGWWPAQRPDDVHVTTLPLPMSDADISAFNAMATMEGWLKATAAAPGPPAVPARDGVITTREKLVAHFQKLGFVRAADSIGERRTNRETLYVEKERDAIPP